MGTSLRLLLVEDSEDDALLLLRELRRGGLEAQYRRVDSAAGLRAALADGDWDLVVSDYSMPHFDGLSAYALVREHDTDLPFIFVSGRIGEERAVDAMRRGVSDYLQKDNLSRLVPAVQRELRDAATRRERRAAEAALRASEERLRHLAHNAPDIIYEYALQPEPHFAYVSPAATEVTGFTPEEHYADAELWLRIVHDEEREILRALLLTGSDGPSGSQIMRWHHRDGRPRWVEQRTTPIYSGDTLTGIEGIVRDITDRKELEAQLLASQRMEAIGRLAGGIAHDFNNMLTVIGGYCSLLRRKLPEEDVRLRDVGKIESATERATALVRQLLAFSRRQPRNLEVLDFAAVVTEFAPMFRRLIGENIQVAVNCPEEPLPIRADRSQLEQILMNLVVNARDAMPEGGHLTIEADLTEVEDLVSHMHIALAPGRYVRLIVSDTGIGMEEQVRAHIFDPFYTTKEVGVGTGLGLSTVYGIVKQMEGDVWVYSEPGLGSTFKIFLPCTEGAPQRTAASQPEDRLHGRETILLVEDEDLVREAAEEILSSHGYTILPAHNGEDALHLLAAHEREIDLLLTDLLMPKMNGVELAARLREQKPDLRVLYTTGYSESSLPGQCSPNSSSSVLQKPFGSQALLRKVREVLKPPAPCEP